MGLLTDAFRTLLTYGSESKRAVASAIPTWQVGMPATPLINQRSYDQLARKGYMGSEIVYAAVQAIAKSAALPKLVAYGEEHPASFSTEVHSEPIVKHPALSVLNRPNPFWTHFQLWSSTVVAIKINGNAYWERVRDRRGRVVQYWPLRPDRVWVIPDDKEFIRGYEYRLGDQTFQLKREDIIHFKTTHPLNDYYGLAPLAVLAERIDIDVWTREFTTAFFRNAGVPSGLLNIMRSVEPNEREIIRQRFRQQYGGPDGWGNTLVIDNGQATYTKMGMDPGNIGLGEINNISESRICCLPTTRVMTKRGMIPIPEVMVGDEVLTHQARWRKVLRTTRNPLAGRGVIEVRAAGFESLRVTTNHKVYVARYGQTRSHHGFLKTFAWKPAIELKPHGIRGDFDAVTMPMLAETEAVEAAPLRLIDHVRVDESYFGMGVVAGRLRSNHPRIKDLPATVPLNAAMGRLLGYYLAEGCTGGGQVHWTFATGEVAYQQEVLHDLREVFGLEARLYSRGPVTDVVVQNALLARLFGELRARRKRIPEWAWEGGIEFRSALLQSWANGDGTLTKVGTKGGVRRRRRVTTMSLDLAWGMRVLAVSLGLPAYIQTAKTPYSAIDGRVISAGGDPVYTVEWMLDRDPKRAKLQFEGTHLTSRVRSVEVVSYDGDVYDLHVEDDHSYLTDGGCVSNCSVLDVPPSIIWTVLGHQSAAGLNNSNKESDRAQWWIGALAPLYEDLAQQFSLASAEDWPDVDHFDFDMSQVPGYGTDQDAKHARVRADYQAGLVPWHVAAQMLGYPIDDPGWILMPANVILTPSPELAKYKEGDPVPGQGGGGEAPPGGVPGGPPELPPGGGVGALGEGAAEGGGGEAGAGQGGLGALGSLAGIGETMMIGSTTSTKTTVDGQFEIIPGCPADNLGAHYRSKSLGICAWCGQDPYILKVEVDTTYDYISTQLNLPDILGRELVQWVRETIDPDDLGSEGIETNPHVTVKYGLMPSVGPSDVARVLKDHPPARLTFGVNYVFAGDDHGGGVPLYVSVESEDLGHMNGVLKRSLPNVETHSNYQPHVTVAYIQPASVSKYVGGRAPIYGMHITLNDLTYSDTDGHQVRIPLLGDNKALSEGLDSAGGIFVPPEWARPGNARRRRTTQEVLAQLDFWRDQFSDSHHSPADFQKCVESMPDEPLELSAWLFHRSTGTWPTKLDRGVLRQYKQGNLEALLDYWQDRMGSPGDFDACVETMTGKVDDPEALCAWLHHEATGEWPGEHATAVDFGGFEHGLVDRRDDLTKRVTEHVRQMERSLLQSGVPVQPYRPKTQTWLSVLDNKEWDESRVTRDEGGRFSEGGGGAGAAGSTQRAPGPPTEGSRADWIDTNDTRGWLEAKADSQNLFKTGSGPNKWDGYTQERLETVHNPAVERAMNGVYEDHEQGTPGGIPPVEGRAPVLTIMAGGGSSGKSSLLRDPEASAMVNAPSKDQAVWSNSDWNKEKDIPEYGKMVQAGDKGAAFAVHEESSDLAARIVDTALRGNRDTVMDAVMGGSIGKLQDKVESYRAAGAGQINANYLTVPIPQAQVGAQGRAERTGREVPMEELIRGHTSVNAMLPQILEASANGELYDTVTVFDNSADETGKWVPVPIARASAGGRVEVLDSARWANALRRSDPTYTKTW